MSMNNGTATRTIGWDSIESSVDAFELKQLEPPPKPALNRKRYILSRAKRDLAKLSELGTIYGLSDEERTHIDDLKSAMRASAVEAFADIIGRI